MNPKQPSKVYQDALGSAGVKKKCSNKKVKADIRNPLHYSVKEGLKYQKKR